MEFSNLICGSEKVTIIDADKPRVSLVEVDCEKHCRRWIIGNFVSDNGVFVVKDECHKNQQTLLHVPWTGRTIIEEKCDEFEGHLMYLTKSEESLIKKSCSKTWRSANSTDQLRGLGPKSDYDKDQKTEVAMFSFFYVDS